MARLSNINNYKAAKEEKTAQQQQQQPTASPPTAPKPTQPSFASMADNNPMAGATNVGFREKTLQNLDETDFDKRQAELNASNKEYYAAQFKKNPDSSYYLLRSYLESDETPEEKRKRERREALGETFRNLGNVIGNAANLYYTSKGGQYIDLNTANEKHNERMRQIKAKQDALKEQRERLFANAKMEDFKNERAQKAANAKAAQQSKEEQIKYERDLVKMQIENAYKLGLIDAETKAKLSIQADKAESDKDIERVKHNNRMTLKTTPASGQDKVLTSITGSDGNVYTRSTKMDEVEIRELAKYVEDWSPYTTVDEYGKETIDYVGAISDAADSGLIPTDVLEERGFKKGKSSSKKGGYSYATNKKSGYSYKQ